MGDGRRHVSLAITVRRYARTYATDAWSARVVLVVEAGEEMKTLARDLDSLLATTQNRQ
ncbi:DUF6228 family protein [Asanoa sp. NPDC049475]|uniref:DUF6228 family protein n=1 Tax=Asanoa sp. NPDC049475 TaxID=3154728 RepID=UPI00342DE63C